MIAWLIVNAIFGVLFYYGVYSAWPVGTIIFIVVGAIATILLAIWIFLCCGLCMRTFSVAAASSGFGSSSRCRGSSRCSASSRPPAPFQSCPFCAVRGGSWASILATWPSSSVCSWRARRAAGCRTHSTLALGLHAAVQELRAYDVVQGHTRGAARQVRAVYDDHCGSRPVVVGLLAALLRMPRPMTTWVVVATLTAVTFSLFAVAHAAVFIARRVPVPARAREPHAPSSEAPITARLPNDCGCGRRAAAVVLPFQS